MNSENLSLLVASVATLGITLSVSWYVFSFDSDSILAQPNLQPTVSSNASIESKTDFELAPDRWALPHWNFSSVKATPTPSSSKPIRQIQLAAILPRGDSLVAAIAPGPGMPPYFMKAGDTRDGIHVQTITLQEVHLTVDTLPVVLGISP